MNFACKFCNNNKVYCHCYDCEIFLCSQCDYYQHVPELSPSRAEKDPVESIHKRIRICEECEEEECATFCLNCEQFLCVQCSKRLHKKGARQKHQRQSLNLSPELRKPSKPKSQCSSLGKHISQGDSQSSRKNSTETDYFTESSQNHISKNLSQSHSQVFNDQRQTYYTKSKDAYGGRQSQFNAVGRSGQRPHQRQGKSSGYSPAEESSSGSYPNSYSNYRQPDHYYSSYHVGKGASKYKKGGSSNYAGSQGLSGQQGSQDYIPSQYYGNSNMKNKIYIEGDQVVIPIWQPFVKCEENSNELLTIQKELFDMASNGDLLIEYDLFVRAVSAKLQLNESECHRFMDLAEQQGIVHQTKRNFAKMKTLSFVSLQLEIITHECITWVLTSLKKDEMTPTERAVQSRIKEAFAFKITTSLWDYMMESLTNKEYTTLGIGQKIRQVTIQPSNSGKSLPKPNSNSYNEYYNVSKYKNKNQPQTSSIQFIYQEKKQDVPEFKIRDIEEDPSIGQMTKVIYFKNEEEWIGVDQNIDIVEYELYEELKSFLYNYFVSSNDNFQDEEEKWCSSIENALTRNNLYTGSSKTHNQNYQDIDLDEVRAIPGGRYGCAQFVKICGPQSLKSCSLGKLAQLVQYAIKEDVLRYHKTLLVWTTTIDKHKKLNEQMQKESQRNATIAAKLTIVKNALLEILAESKSGMSLAQLPLYLRRKLPFSLDLNELGFPKLKDLILSMSEKIKLELRGHNHPFAYLIKSGRYVHAVNASDDFQTVPKQREFIKSTHPHLSEDVNVNRHLNNALALNENSIKKVLQAFYTILREQPMGVKSEEIPKLISSKIGNEFNPKQFQCQSMLEFLKKFLVPTMEIEIIFSGVKDEESFSVRSKQFFLTYTLDLSQNLNNKQKNLENANANEANMQFNRQNSGNSSLNVTSQAYIPTAQSMYGGSTSANTTHINVSHIRFNTADTNEINSISFTKQDPQQQQQQTYVQKPPLAPSIQQERMNQQQMFGQVQQKQNPQKSNQFRTYPPPMQQQFLVQSQPQFSNQMQFMHQQSPSNVTNFSNQSIGIPNYPRGPFLSPGQLQQSKFNQNDAVSSVAQYSPLHNRAISSMNQGSGVMQSTTSKSVSQDFSIQSQSIPNTQPFKNVPFGNSSGFTTPQQYGYFGMHNLQARIPPQQIESFFSSPNQKSNLFDASSLKQFNYYNFEGSPPYEQDDDEGLLDQNNIKFVEKLICDDEVEYKSVDAMSYQSMHSPPQSTLGLRVPVSSFQGQVPGQRQIVPKTWSQIGTPQSINQGGVSKGLMQMSNSCKNLSGAIIEGNSSSSDENKRPSIVQEQKTEEDLEDNSNGGNPLSRNHTQMQENSGENPWMENTQLFQ